MGNKLQCPICEKPKFYTEDSFTHGLRYHLEQFHMRVDATRLIELARYGEAVGEEEGGEEEGEEKEN